MRLLTVPGVFRPRSDSRLLAGLASARVRAGDSVLDPFTGSGILAIACARAGAARVSAVDVSRRAVWCTRLNAALNGVRLDVRRGDFRGALSDERFDLIVANPPYLPGPPSGGRGAARAWEGGADGRALIDRLCLWAAEHLTADGELLIVHSSVCGAETTLERLRAGGLDGTVVATRRGPLGPLLLARAPELERRGLLRPDQREEELVVFSARHAEASRPEQPGTGGAWRTRESPRTATGPT
jgi:release factor glutamine methyltransferase